MQQNNRIQYLRDPATEIELIVCSRSYRSYPLHNHVSVFTIGLLLEGAVTLTVNGAATRCGKNQSFLIPPYVPHTVRANGPYSLLTLCIHKNTIASHSIPAMEESIRHLLRAISGLTLTKEQSNQLQTRLNALSPPPVPYAPDPATIYMRLQTQPEMQISVSELARAACFSKFHFIRRFKETVGLTPHQFQIQNRIRKAQHLLTETGNITETAFSAGFCDQSHFARQFKKHVGLTPAAYIDAYAELPPSFAVSSAQV